MTTHKNRSNIISDRNVGEDENFCLELLPEKVYTDNK